MLLVTTMSHEYIAFSAQSIGDEEDLYEDVEGNNFCNRLRFIFSGSITARVRLSRLLSNDWVNIKYMLIDLIESGFLHFQDCICDSVFKISLNFTKLASSCKFLHDLDVYSVLAKGKFQFSRRWTKATQSISLASVLKIRQKEALETLLSNISEIRLKAFSQCRYRYCSRRFRSRASINCFQV